MTSRCHRCRMPWGPLLIVAVGLTMEICRLWSRRGCGERLGDERVEREYLLSLQAPLLLRGCYGRKPLCFLRSADSAFMTPSRLALGANRVLSRLWSLRMACVADPGQNAYRLVPR